MIEAVIFDMDGVLVDSEPFIREAAVNLFAEKGVKVNSDDFLAFTGMGENRFIGGVGELYGVPIDLSVDKPRLYELYGQLIIGRIQPLAGVLQFIKECRARGLKLAVATSADTTKLNQNLNELNMPPASFDACVTGSDVTHTKPHPEIFLTAAHKIGIDPSNCLVIEDAPAGVDAARAAGSRCLALTTSFDESALAHADWIAPDLSAWPAEALD